MAPFVNKYKVELRKVKPFRKDIPFSIISPKIFFLRLDWSLELAEFSGKFIFRFETCAVQWGLCPEFSKVVINRGREGYGVLGAALILLKAYVLERNIIINQFKDSV